MIALAFGGGTNSTAVLVGMDERGIRPDVIMFSDTGGEKPETYRHIEDVSRWCEKIGFPPIDVVRVASKTLEQDCIDRNALPSVAYGFKTCSIRFKAEPQEKFLNNHDGAKAVWNAGGKVIKTIGFDFGEPQRAKHYEDDKYVNWYPLIEWRWGRPECVAAIARAGIKQPGKSSCFFCPNSRPSEIQQLKHTHPDLFERALKIESGANLTTVRGLGRTFAWATLDSQREWVGFRDMPCECYDGESA